MAVHFYFDVHVPMAITDQLRRRGHDVLTAQEDGATELPDDQLVERAVAKRRVLFTFDKRLKGMLEGWQRQGRHFTGLLWGKADSSIGSFVKDLDLIATASEMSEWENRIEFVPF